MSDSKLHYYREFKKLLGVYSEAGFTEHWLYYAKRFSETTGCNKEEYLNAILDELRKIRQQSGIKSAGWAYQSILEESISVTGMKNIAEYLKCGGDRDKIRQLVLDGSFEPAKPPPTPKELAQQFPAPTSRNDAAR